jgi:hypothetical protein
VRACTVCCSSPGKYLALLVPVLHEKLKCGGKGNPKSKPATSRRGGLQKTSGLSMRHGEKGERKWQTATKGSPAKSSWWKT